MLLTLYERVYAAIHGLREILVEGRAYLRIGHARYRGGPVRLPGGAVLHRGDRVLFFHLENGVLAALGRTAPSPVAAGLAAHRAVRRNLEELARRVSVEPAFADVRAVGALTDMWHACERLGFVTAPLRSRVWARTVAWYQRRLKPHRPPMNAPSRPPRIRRCRGEARYVWMATPVFVERFGPAPAGRRALGLGRPPGRWRREAWAQPPC